MIPPCSFYVRLQLLRPLSRISRQWSHTRSFSASRHVLDEKTAPGQASLDLLDKLFRGPRANAHISDRSPRTPTAIDHVSVTDEQLDTAAAAAAAATAVQTQSAHPDTRRMTSAARLYEEKKAQEDKISVLVMSNASLNLLPEDFRSLIPRGKHIEDWNLADGDILHIIPGRNPLTLNRTNTYYLLFRTALSAFIYQGRATKASRMAHYKHHFPTGLPRNGQIDGEDVEELIRAYTLTPPSQRLLLRQLSDPPIREVQDLIACGGYPRLMAMRQAACGRGLVRLTSVGEGLKMSRAQVFRVFRAHERARNMPWTGTLTSSLKVKQFDPSVRHFGKRGVETGAMRQGIKRQTRADEDVAEGGECRDERDHEQTLRKWRPRSQSLLVELETEEQAQAFARFWHNRTIELDSEDSITFEAEYLW